MSLDALLRDPKAVLRELDKLDSADSLAKFVKLAWPVIEPAAPYVHGWHIDAICEHLEAVTHGEITRLLINVPPGAMKSLLVNVFWPSWEWGPMNLPHMRYICAAHKIENLSARDARKMRQVILSDWYQERWGDRVILAKDQNQKVNFQNTATGFRIATAITSLTGMRGNRVVLDDPHSVDSASSDTMRLSETTTFLEAVPTRLDDPVRSAIVVIMQRLHEADVSGVALEKDLGYEHLMLPMEFEPDRKCYTSIGFEDPREEDGELLFPQRFPAEVVERDKRALGIYASAGQLQQAPMPRGGGIIQRDYWQVWPAQSYPDFSFILASADTAYTEKEENDPSAMTVWGVFEDANYNTKVMLIYAWRKRLELHGPDVSPKMPDETDKDYRARKEAAWGLVEWVNDTCERFRVDRLLIESKASGLSVEQEMRRLHSRGSFGVELVNPGSKDKVARAHAVQPMFTDGMIFAPDKAWADLVIDECASFPRGRYKDLTDTTTQALNWLRKNGILIRRDEARIDLEDRKNGILIRRDEARIDLEDSLMHRSSEAPLYEV